MSEHERHLWTQTFVAHLQHGEGNGIAAQLADKAVCVYRAAANRINSMEAEARGHDYAQAH